MSTTSTRRQLPASRGAIACLALASALSAVLLPALGSSTPSGCASIADVPPEYVISYGAAIQGLFDNFASNGASAGCVDCHTDPASGASGQLDLTDGISWSDLVNVPSNEDSSLTYVVPNHPEQSLLFQKVNCSEPDVGNQMPYNNYGGGLTIEQQALIYDWIADGALSGTSNTIFRNGFDSRGYSQ